jgi:hypothetical protein
VLAWTLPADVAADVRAAGGSGVPNHPGSAMDFAVQVSRRAQLRAIRAHRSLAAAEPAQRIRLDVQGDQEWLHWLVIPSRGVRTQGS